MGKRRILKKASAILCVFCILISMLANGAVVFAADDETVTEGTVIVQSGNTETNEEKPEGGGSAGGGEETQVQIPQEGNDTDQQETSDEKTETGETAASAPSAEKPDQTSSGSTDENTGESTEGATDKPADKTSADETSADETSAETSTESASESDAVSKTEPVSEKEEETVPKMRKARSAVSTNLADFLTEVMISAPQDEEGNYIINPNSTYEMTLSFNENEGVQFDDEALLTYSFPEGVTINDVGSTPFSITVKDEKGTAVVNGNTFEVVNGQLRVRFNQDDPNFDRLKVMPNVKFSIAISSSFHQTAGEIVETLNAKAPENLALAMKEVGGLLIHISTDYVFGGDPYNTPCREDQKGTPTGVYGLTKLHGEQKIMATGAHYIIFRTAWLYSEFGHNFLKTMLNLTATKPQLKVVFDQCGTPTYAGDLARCIFQILENRQFEGHDGIYHFSNEGVCSWYDFTKAIAAFAGNTACDIQPCHSDEFPSPVKRPAYSVLDKTKVKETFGIKIPYWIDALKTCMDNMKALKK